MPVTPVGVIVSVVSAAEHPLSWKEVSKQSLRVSMKVSRDESFLMISYYQAPSLYHAALARL